jgi:hypothetical protein
MEVRLWALLAGRALAPEISFGIIPVTQKQVIAETPAKWSAYQIPGIISVFAVLVSKVQFVSLIAKSHKRPRTYSLQSAFVLRKVGRGQYWEKGECFLIYVPCHDLWLLSCILQDISFFYLLWIKEQVLIAAALLNSILNLTPCTLNYVLCDFKQLLSFGLHLLSIMSWEFVIRLEHFVPSSVIQCLNTEVTHLFPGRTYFIWWKISCFW